MKRRYALLAVPIVAGALAILWWAPWSFSPDPVSRAREAFGNQRVVHVVTRPTTLRSDSPLRPLMTVKGDELWYDTSSGRIHLVQERKDVVARDWIAASVLRGSQTTPLAAFVRDYLSDLAHHTLRDDGKAVVQNRSVIWLRSAAYRVAVDPVSYQPLWLSGTSSSEGTELLQLVVAETKPYDPADFLTAKQKKPRHL